MSLFLFYCSSQLLHLQSLSDIEFKCFLHWNRTQFAEARRRSPYLYTLICNLVIPVFGQTSCHLFIGIPLQDSSCNIWPINSLIQPPWETNRTFHSSFSNCCASKSSPYNNIIFLLLSIIDNTKKISFLI